MNTIKKYLPILLVSFFTAIATILVYNYMNTNQNQSQNTNENGYFTNAKLIGLSANNGTDFTQAADKTVNAVVSIKNYSSQNRGMNLRDFFFGFNDDYGYDNNSKNSPTGLGSGVIISEDGYIITNNHVIKDANKIEVTLNNQQTYEAEIVGTDPNSDIALIKIKENNLAYLNFSNSDNAKIGEWVLAVGNPFGLTSTVTAGIISAKGRSINILSNTESPIESFIQTDAAINPGNSGGALVNGNGDLIGINTAISSHSGSFEGYGFAVPSNIAKKIVEDLKKYGLVQRGYIGIVPLDLTNDQALALYNRNNNTDIKTQQGVLVVQLSQDGAAYDAGIKEGDIITMVDNVKIKNFATLSSVLASKRPGDYVNVELTRGNATKTFKLKLKDAKGNTKLRNKEDLSVAEVLGAEFQSLSDNQKIDYGLESGVWVTKISSNSPLKKAGINKDYIILQINDKDVNSSKDIEKILAKYTGNVKIQFVDQYGRVYQRGFQYN